MAQSPEPEIEANIMEEKMDSSMFHVRPEGSSVRISENVPGEDVKNETIIAEELMDSSSPCEHSEVIGNMILEKVPKEGGKNENIIADRQMENTAPNEYSEENSEKILVKVPKKGDENERSITEDQMDSSSCQELHKDDGVRVSEKMPNEGGKNEAEKSVSSALDTQKNRLTVHGDNTPFDRFKPGNVDKSVNEGSSSATIEVGSLESSMAPDSANILSPSNEASKENAAHPKSSDKSELPCVVSMPENCESRFKDLSKPEDFTDDNTNKNQNESNIEEPLKETGIKSLDLPMDTTGPSKKLNQKNEADPSSSKGAYRETIHVSDSDSDSEHSESSSVSSLSSPSKSECDSDSDIECLTQPVKTKKGTYPVIKAKGELLPEDLPPIEELHISVPSSLCAEIGVVTSIVKTLVVIQSLKGLPALDLDSVLFLDSGSRTLGLVFDVFGPVTEPLYCVRFNSEEQIAEFKVNPGDKVYYAPETEHSKYVFLQQLLRMKGSDASKQNDLERQVQIEYSDDEEERKAWEQHGDVIRAEEEGLDPDQLKRKRDPNEVLEKKKKFALQFPPRNQSGIANRWQSSQRARPHYQGTQHRQGQQNRQGPQNRQSPQNHQGPQCWQSPRQQYCPPPRHQGPIHPPSFNIPPPPIPGSSVQHQDPLPGTSDNTSQGGYNRPFYQHPMQHMTSSFGQLPCVQSPIDPRIAQFGAQFAQMVCNLQSSASGGSIGAAPQATPSFSVPYNQTAYPGSQSGYNAFYEPPLQSVPSTYSAPSFSAPPPPPPPPVRQPNLHEQIPFLPQRNVQPNQNSTFSGQYSSTFSSYQNYR